MSGIEVGAEIYQDMGLGGMYPGKSMPKWRGTVEERDRVAMAFY
jgi:hypothetical protein